MDSLSILAQCLVDKFTISNTAAEAFVREFFDVIREQLATDKIVKVKGFGTFKIVEVSAREMIDINTRERITIGARNRIVFTPEAAVRDRINSPFAQFESIELDEDTDLNGAENGSDGNEGSSVVEEETTHVSAEDVQAPQEEVTIVQDDSNGKEEEEMPSRTAIPMRGVYLSLALIAVVLMVLVGYLCYTAGVKQLFNNTPQSTIIEEEVSVVEATTDATTSATTQSTLPKDSITASRDGITATAEVEDYDRDPRVRLGAYDIVGLHTVVVVQPQQTLAGISRAYLGDGMQCYVEVYNGGIKSVAVGDTLRIPKVMLKKRNKTKKRTSVDGTHASD